MKRLFLAVGLMLLFVSFANWGYAQTLKGSVKDSTGKVMPYATVSLKDITSNAIIAYAVTDSKGSFSIQVSSNAIASSLVVEARSLGYKTSVKSVTNFDVLLDFTLTVVSNNLQEVVIKNSQPVLRTHGDTLNYKVSDFANQQDRTIGEVIKKLPGITVAANGTISYNNKPISAVYIGGDNLLDDKYSIATNSIPQGAVNQVQVIQNDQPIKALQNKVMSDNVALNLEIKKGAKLHLMGEESVGVGLPGNYEIDLTALMFKDNYKAINYLAGNNIGYDVQQSLVSHNLTEYNQLIDNALPATVLSLGAVNTPALAENRYFFDQAAVLNLNNLVNLKNNVQLRVNGYYVHDTQQQDFSQQTTVFLPSDTVKFKEIQHNRSVPNIFHAQFTLNINRPQYYLNEALIMDQKNVINYSELKTDSSAVNQLYKDNTLNFTNEFNLIKVLKSNNIVQAYSYVSHSNGPENLTIGPNYNPSIFNNGVPYARLVQNVNIPSWYTNNYFTLRIPSGSFTQSYKTGFSFQSQKLKSGLNVLQNNNSINLESDSAVNDVIWTKKKLYAEAAYDLPGKILQANLTLPLTFQQVAYSDNSYALNRSLTRLYFNPQFRLKYQVGKENYLSFIYSYRNQIGTIENIYPGYILTNYRTRYANNADLTQQQSQQAGGGFSYRKALTLFFWSINALYNRTEANNIASSLITNNITEGIVLPYRNSTDSWILKGTISKYSFALNTTFSGAISWQNTRSVQIQNNTLLPFNTTTEAYNINTNTKVTDDVNFSYKVTLTQTGSHSLMETSGFQIEQIQQQASVNYEPVENIQFNLFGEQYLTRQRGRSDLKSFFADASVKYRITKWKTDLQLNANNLLNVKSYNSLYLTSNNLTANSYTLPGRIVLVKVMFNL